MDWIYLFSRKKIVHLNTKLVEIIRFPKYLFCCEATFVFPRRRIEVKILTCRTCEETIYISRGIYRVPTNNNVISC